ncbi:MAG: DUF4870 domain-containing protein [Acidobacteriota bacterium]|nr:DUF4870 domain-containing protein [Acidobacteriota bacterium]
MTELPSGQAMSPAEEKNWAMFCHLAALSGFLIPLGNILGPLIVWLIKKDASPLVDAEGKKSLNFQISILIYMVISALLIFVLIGIPLMIAVGIFALVMIILAAIKTSNGEDFRYPLSIQFLR